MKTFLNLLFMALALTPISLAAQTTPAQVLQHHDMMTQSSNRDRSTASVTFKEGDELDGAWFLLARAQRFAPSYGEALKIRYRGESWNIAEGWRAIDYCILDEKSARERHLRLTISIADASKGLYTLEWWIIDEMIPQRGTICLTRFRHWRGMFKAEGKGKHSGDVYFPASAFK